MTETIRSILEDVDPHNPLLLIQPPTVVLPNYVERRQHQFDLDGTSALQEQQLRKKRKKKRNTSAVQNSPITGSEVDNMLMEIYKDNK